MSFYFLAFLFTCGALVGATISGIPIAAFYRMDESFSRLMFELFRALLATGLIISTFTQMFKLTTELGAMLIFSIVAGIAISCFINGLDFLKRTFPPELEPEKK